MIGVMRVRLDDSSDRLGAPRRHYQVSAAHDRRRLIPPLQAYPAGAHCPALVRTLECAGHKPADPEPFADGTGHTFPRCAVQRNST